MTLNIKKQNNILLIFTVVLLTVALYARDLLGIGINKYIYIVLTVVPALFMSYSSLIYFIFFLFPIVRGLPFNFIYPILAAILLFKNPKAFSEKAMYCFIIIVFFEFVHYPFYDFGFRVANIISYLTVIFFLCYLSSLKDAKVKNIQCLLYFCIGLVVFLFAIWYITRFRGGVMLYAEETSRVGGTKKLLEEEENTMMMTINANGLGYLSLVGLSVVFVLYYLRKLRFVPLLIMSAVYVFVGALSISRTWLFGVVLLVVLLMFMMRRVHTTRNRIRYFMLIALVLFGGYIMLQNEFIYGAFYNRLTDASMETGNGRIEIFHEYNQALINNPICLFFGAGAVHHGMVFDEVHVAVHNGPQQILVSYGIIGLVFFIFITIKAIKYNYRKGFIACVIPFIVAFFFVQTGQLLFPYYNLYPFIVSFVVMRLSDDEKVLISQ